MAKNRLQVSNSGKEWKLTELKKFLLSDMKV